MLLRALSTCWAVWCPDAGAAWQCLCVIVLGNARKQVGLLRLCALLRAGGAHARGALWCALIPMNCSTARLS